MVTKIAQYHFHCDAFNKTDGHFVLMILIFLSIMPNLAISYSAEALSLSTSDKNKCNVIYIYPMKTTKITVLYKIKYD